MRRTGRKKFGVRGSAIGDRLSTVGDTPIKAIPPQARRVSTAEKNKILTAARDVVELYSELDKIFSQLPQRRTGHNRSPDQVKIAEVIKNDKVVAEATAKELQEVIQQKEAERGVVNKIRKAFAGLRDRAKKLGAGIKSGMLKDIGEGVGKEAAESYVPALLNMLVIALARLVQLMKDFF